MAPRSARNKLRYQVLMAAKSIDGCLVHLRRADEQAGTQHPVVREHMPAVVSLLVAVREMLIRFRAAL
jgi:hypothetical protein